MSGRRKEEQSASAASSSGGAPPMGHRPSRGSVKVCLKRMEDSLALFRRAEELAAENAGSPSATESPTSTEEVPSEEDVRLVALAPVFDLDPNLGRKSPGGQVRELSPRRRRPRQKRWQSTMSAIFHTARGAGIASRAEARARLTTRRRTSTGFQ